MQSHPQPASLIANHLLSTPEQQTARASYILLEASNGNGNGHGCSAQEDGHVLHGGGPVRWTAGNGHARGEEEAGVTNRPPAGSSFWQAPLALNLVAPCPSEPKCKACVSACHGADVPCLDRCQAGLFLICPRDPECEACKSRCRIVTGRPYSTLFVGKCRNECAGGHESFHGRRQVPRLPAALVVSASGILWVVFLLTKLARGDAA